jgi:phasin family protein
MLQCTKITGTSNNLQFDLKELTMFNKPQDFFKAPTDLVLFLANTTFNSIERIAALNLTAGRSFMEASFANYSSLLGAKDVQSLIKLQQSLGTPALEKGIDYSRNLYAITSETKNLIAKQVETHVAESNAKVTGLVEKALANAPAGSEVAVAAVKTAINAANEAYEGLNKAAKQATEVAEANVAAATAATLKASKKAA